MFSPVYVLLPFSDLAPAEAIRASLAPFQRGGKGDVPEDWLAFHDETDEVRALHTAEFIFTSIEGGGTQVEGGDTHVEGGDTHALDIRTIKAEMSARGVRRWAVRFADLEPELPTFVDKYLRGLERHPVSGGYGRWLNPLGRWDWWDLGGRFDGRIAGERHRGGRAASVVSSGANRGRALLSNIADTLGRALGSEPPTEVVVEADNNIEVVSRLLEDARAGHDHAVPGAILLPPGLLADAMRWLRSWPEIGPTSTLSWLGLPVTAGWKQVVTAAYARFPDHWAAGVAFHL